MSDNREQSLKEALKSIEKQYGKGAVMVLGNEPVAQLDVISSGSLLLDSALGVGGYPKGRIIEIYGPESSGKTTFALHAIAEAQKAGGYAAFIDAEHALDPKYAKALGIGGYPKGRVIEIYGPESSGKTTFALHAIAEAQKLGGYAAFIDAEHALDPKYAKNLGVNIEELVLSQPDSGEQALEIAEALIKSGAIDIIVIDSVAALVPEAEINGEMGDSHVGLQARLMSQAMRKLSGIISKTKCVAIFINQIREKVGVMYGNPETTPGGRALKFYSTIRLDVRRGEQLKSGSEAVGNKTVVKVVKNKVAPPFKVAEVEIIYGEGISKMGELIDTAVSLNIINKAGAWFSYNGEKIGQGRENVKAYLKANPQVYNEIYEKIKG